MKSPTHCEVSRHVLALCSGLCVLELISAPRSAANATALFHHSPYFVIIFEELFLIFVYFHNVAPARSIYLCCPLATCTSIYGDLNVDI